MTHRSPRDWTAHGRHHKTPSLAGVLPHQGVHYLQIADQPSRTALIADLAVAAASDTVVCGLSEPDDTGTRSSLAGFFGRPTSQLAGVAIVANFHNTDAVSRAVTARRS